MSHFKVLINNTDVTKRCVSINELKEFSDQTVFFAGIFQFSALNLSFNNNNRSFDTGTSLFPQGRNNQEVKVLYTANNPDLDDRLVFIGLINEGATENDLTNRVINFTVQSYLKLLEDISVNGPADQQSIDRRYGLWTGRGDDIRLDKDFIAAYLYQYIVATRNLNNIFNVFNGSNYRNINASIESIFPPADQYYTANNDSVLSLLNNLISSLNSYSTLIYKDRAYLHIKARPVSRSRQASKTLDESMILKLDKKTDGFTKLYNKIIINGSEPYVAQDSINRYGPKLLNIGSFAPASSALANSYLNFYKNPKAELSISVKITHETLDYSIGDTLYIDQKPSDDFKISKLSGYFSIFEKSIDIGQEEIDLRVREV